MVAHIRRKQSCIIIFLMQLIYLAVGEWEKYNKAFILEKFNIKKNCLNLFLFIYNFVVGIRATQLYI